MKHLIGCYNRSVILTHIGILAALVGIAFVKNRDLAVICLIAAGICDLFDGVIAQRCKRDDREKAFGVQLDSLADLISFGAFPFVFLVNFVSDAPAGAPGVPAENAFRILAVAVGAVYVLAAVTRLGWFNVTVEENRGFFQGMPVTYSALIIACIYPLSYLLGERVMGAVYIAVYAIMAALFVLNFKVKKPRGAAYIAFGLLAIAVTVIIALHWSGVLA